MLLKPERVAKELQMSIYTIKNWLRDGTIRGVKVGNTWRISKEELDRIKSGKPEVENGDD